VVIESFSLSTYIAIPLVLSLLVEGGNVKLSIDKNVRQVSSINQETIAPSPQLISTKATGATYYVNARGNDKNSGLSSSSAFRTIQKAANLTNPGDTVLIMNGVYTNANPKGQIVLINRSGTANAWIKFKAYPGHSPKLRINGWNAVLINNGASYIEVNGLEIIGNNANVTLDYAMSQKNNKLNPLTNGNCITIDGSKNGHTHHIRILNNKVHDCGGGGVSALESDYVTVNNNEIFNNAWYSVYGCSGISMLNNWNFDRNRGYKMFVRNNKTYNNRQYIPWIKTGTILDGNGIIIDTSRNNQENSKLDAYEGPTLIQNNLTFKNGGSGIHTFQSNHVDIVNNTAFLNNQTPELNGGQIFANTSSDIQILRNIFSAPSGKNVNSKNQIRNVVYDYNIYLKPSSVTVKGPHDIVADSEFISAHPNLKKLVGDSKPQLYKQNRSLRSSTDINAANFVCEPVIYTVKGKVIKIGCSR
jgi:parallel beta-helix repeat protein